MLTQIRQDAHTLIRRIVRDNLPHRAVENALKAYDFQEGVYLLAIGKAGFSMAKAASDALGDRIKEGLVITKYGHAGGAIPRTEVVEAGHPLPDENTLLGTQKAIGMAERLGKNDRLLLLISGGGSALFEKPLAGITLADIAEISERLLSCGADIVEINKIRKRLSAVKAGRFAELCKPAQIFAVVLSDVLGDRLDAIASGPVFADPSTAEQAMAVVNKYGLSFSHAVLSCLSRETPKVVSNVEAIVTGSVRTLCESAAKHASSLGYAPYLLTTGMDCEAREAGRLIASIAAEVGRPCCAFQRPCAIIMGGETVVSLRWNGKGGRNQELALAAAVGMDGVRDAVLLSFGSDGTDGPTDAAGGIVDGTSVQRLADKGVDVHRALAENDSYPALEAIEGLIRTGPTGTNVNDVCVLLCK